MANLKDSQIEPRGCECQEIALPNSRLCDQKKRLCAARRAHKSGIGSESSKYLSPELSAMTASHRFLWPHALWLRKTGSGTSRLGARPGFGPGVLRKLQNEFHKSLELLWTYSALNNPRRSTRYFCCDNALGSGTYIHGIIVQPLLRSPRCPGNFGGRRLSHGIPGTSNRLQASLTQAVRQDAAEHGGDCRSSSTNSAICADIR